jgi:DNA-binding beta-propeller fold protein YncE
MGFADLLQGSFTRLYDQDATCPCFSQKLSSIAYRNIMKHYCQFVRSWALFLCIPLALILGLSKVFSAPLESADPIVVVGTKGKFDYLQVDEQLHRLLADHTGNRTLDVINLPDGKLIKSLPTGAAQGVAIDVDRNYYYVTVSDQRKLAIVDRTTLQVIGGVALPGPPDSLTYCPKNGMVYVDHDDEQDVWVVDPKAQNISGTVKVPPAPEYVLYDSVSNRIFQNIKSEPTTLEIDPDDNAIRATWSTLPAERPHGLAIDAQTRRLFSAGGNGKLVVLDAVTGASLGSVAIATGVDQIAFDPVNKRIYCASGRGKLSVLKETERGVESLGDISTPPGAHTLAIDPATHSVWIAFAKEDAAYIAELKVR